MRCYRLVRLLSLCLLIVFFTGFAVVGQTTVIATEEKNQQRTTQKSHDIAVVFDNSASMYAKTDDGNPKNDKGKDRWVYAKYAMGVFASMIDYSKDSLSLFPMWDITADDSKTQKTKKLDIRTPEDVKKINRIYTPTPHYTPMTACQDAKKFLDSKPHNNEKWLIVLTDGGFTYESGGKIKKYLQREVIPEINKWASSGVKVQFLTFGEGKKYGADNAKTIFEYRLDSVDELEDGLIEICNTIFNRDELDKNDFFDSSSGKITLNVSSSSLFIFDQGQNSSLKLVDSQGKQIGHEPPIFINGDKNGKYSAGKSPGKTHNYYNLAKSIKYPALNGSVVLFDECKTGEYTLSGYSNKVRIFYQPDVYVNVALKKDGKEISEKELKNGINPEEYEIEYSLNDSKTNNPVPKEAKLNEKLKAYVKSNGETKEYNSGDKLKFEPEQNVDIEVKGDYLDGKYKISTNDNGGIKLKGIKILPEGQFYKVKVNVKQIAGLYTLMEHDGWKPIIVNVTRDGKKLSEEELKDVKISISPRIPFSLKMIPKDSSYEIEIGKNKKREYIEPEKGNYKVTASIKHADEFGREMTGSDSSGFRITPLPAWLIWLIWILAILLLIALIIFILNLPAWPARMVCVIEKPKKAKGRLSISPSGGTMRLVPFKHELTATVKKNSKLKDKFSKKASVKVVSVTPNKKIQSFSVGSNTYTKENKFLDGGGKPFTGVIRNGTQISMTFTASEPLSAKININ